MRAVVGINSGSSSIKFSLFSVGEDDEPAARSRREDREDRHSPTLETRSVDDEILLKRDRPGGASLFHAALLADLFAWAAEHPLEGREIIAIGPS